MSQVAKTYKADPDDVIAPDQIIGALIGADFAVLHGFGSPSRRDHFLLPMVSTFDPQQSVPASRQTTKDSRRLVLAAVVIMLVCTSTLAFWAGQMHLSGSPESSALSAPVVWTVKSVTETGVLVHMGTVTLVIPIGAILPSGEILRGVNVRLQNFFTDTQVTVVK